MFLRLLALLAFLAAPFAARAETPRRIVSLDYCADQFVLGLADRGQIAGLSRGADKDDSYFRSRAAGLPRVRDNLESVLALRPDLIVRNWGGGADAVSAYRRFGIPVLHVGEATDFQAARAELLAVSAAFGHSARGRTLAEDLDRRLTALAASAPAHRPRVLYLTAGGAVAGKGVMLDAVIRAAGAENAAHAPGWSVLPLERLVADPPRFVALGFFDSGQAERSAWSLSRNSALAAMLAQAKRATLPLGAISCAGWFAIDAAEALNRAARAP